MYIKKLNYKFDIEKLVNEFQYISNLIGWHDSGQICLTYPAGAESNPNKHYIGCTSLRFNNFYNNDILKERDFDTFPKELMNTETYKVYQLLQEQSQNRVGRFRYRRVNKMSEKDFHRDDDKPRYHIAIQTNNYCFFKFKKNLSDKKEIIQKIPADGHLYEFNANDYHAIINNSNIDRIHLFAVLKNPICNQST